MELPGKGLFLEGYLDAGRITLRSLLFRVRREFNQPAGLGVDLPNEQIAFDSQHAFPEFVFRLVLVCHCDKGTRVKLYGKSERKILGQFILAVDTQRKRQVRSIGLFGVVRLLDHLQGD